MFFFKGEGLFIPCSVFSQVLFLLLFDVLFGEADYFLYDHGEQVASLTFQ